MGLDVKKNKAVPEGGANHRLGAFPTNMVDMKKQRSEVRSAGIKRERKK